MFDSIISRDINFYHHMVEFHRKIMQRSTIKTRQQHYSRMVAAAIVQQAIIQYQETLMEQDDDSSGV